MRLMHPVSPTFKDKDTPLSIFGSNQPEYIPLPAYRHGDEAGRVTSRWHTDSWLDRLRILFTGDVYLTLLTFNNPIQPSRISVTPPEV